MSAVASSSASTVLSAPVAAEAGRLISQLRASNRLFATREQLTQMQLQQKKSSSCCNADELLTLAEDIIFGGSRRQVEEVVQQQQVVDDHEGASVLQVQEQSQPTKAPPPPPNVGCPESAEVAAAAQNVELFLTLLPAGEDLSCFMDSGSDGDVLVDMLEPPRDGAAGCCGTALEIGLETTTAVAAEGAEHLSDHHRHQQQALLLPFMPASPSPEGGHAGTGALGGERKKQEVAADGILHTGNSEGGDREGAKEEEEEEGHLAMLWPPRASADGRDEGETERGDGREAGTRRKEDERSGRTEKGEGDDSEKMDGEQQDQYGFPVLSPLLSSSPCPSTSSLLSDLSSAATNNLAHFSPAPSSTSSSSSSCKENNPPFSLSLGGTPQQLSVIALHRKQGPRSMQALKRKVRRYASEGHTYKETARKFGIHHSTVSGWVKAGSVCKVQENSNYFDNHDEAEEKFHLATAGDKPDVVFIKWLKQKRLRSECGKRKRKGDPGFSENVREELTPDAISSKVSEIIGRFGREEVEKKCKWFLLWSDRREERHRQASAAEADSPHQRTLRPAAPSAPNLAYPPAFKLEVALHARRHSQYAASKTFAVARRRIFDWLRQLPRLEDLLVRGQSRKATGRGPRSRDVDKALYDWYCERRESGDRPKSSRVQEKAKELYSKGGHDDMKCSYGWFKRWSQRFKIQLRYSHDDDLLEWILGRFDDNVGVSHLDLQNCGLDLVRKEDPNFKASSGWAMRFCRRHRHMLNPNDAFDLTFAAKERDKDSVGESDDLGDDEEGENDRSGYASKRRLPQRLEERSERFLSLLHGLLSRGAEVGGNGDFFDETQVGAVDELALHFCQQASSAFPSTAASPALDTPTTMLRQAGFQQASAVVILCAKADGELLPPTVLLKGRQQLQDQGVFSSCSCRVVTSCDGCFVTPAILDGWVLRSWLPSVDYSRPSLLVADSAPAHAHAHLHALVGASRGCLALVPRACSARLQPLHRGIKAKFKCFIEESYHRSGAVGKPGPEEIVSWVEEAYQHLRSEKVKPGLNHQTWTMIYNIS